MYGPIWRTKSGKYMQSKSALTFAAIAVAVLAPSAKAQSLIGSTVEFGNYYPTSSSPISSKVSSLVGGNVEFTNIGSLSLPGFVVANADIDVSASQIYIDYSWSGTSASGAFNGYVFNFSNLGASSISGVSLASSTTLPPNKVGLSFDADSVFISLPSTTVSSSSVLAVNVLLTPVPEPMSSALFVAGGIALLAKRMVNRSKKA
jgi:hypothetical protein